MSTTTTNLGLTKPAYSDAADIADINRNMDTIDQAIAGTDNSIAIVADNNTHAAITSGQYVFVRNHGTLAEGLYRATANIAQNGTLSSSNVVAVSGGGLNALNNMLTPVAVMFSPVSDVSVDLGGVYQIGQMVFVNMRIHLETAITNGTVGKFAKAPKPGYYANNYVPIAASIFAETASAVYGYIMNNGDLCVFRDGSLTPQAGYYSVMAMYIAD